jgi:RHS repeat-associated protein
VTYTYDADGHRTSMTDGSGTTSYTYDAAGRLTASTNGAGQTVSYGYDPGGQVTTIGYPNGQTVTQTYDPAGNLASVADWLGHITTFSYDADSDLTSETLPSTTLDVDRYSYDDADHLSAIVSKRGSTLLASLNYSRNSDELVISSVAAGKPKATYSYDAVDQMSKASGGSYSYDPAGNLTKSPTIASPSYNAGDELTALGTGSHKTTYAYDGEGDRISQSTNGKITASFRYDEANRLVGLTGGSKSTSYVFNGNGQLMSEKTGSAATAFAWDTVAPTPVLLEWGSTSFIYGPGGLPLELIAPKTVFFYHHDQLGSTSMLTSLVGTKVATYTYTPYGALISKTGSAANPLLYGGQYRDPESGLYYLQARFYDPATAQFISADPLATLTNTPYAYANDDPINFTDPTGEIFGLDNVGTAILGGLIGGLVGTAVYGEACLLQNSCTLGGLVGSGVGGLLGGACIGFTDGLATALCGAGAQVASTWLSDTIDGEQLSTNQVVLGLVLGGAGGAIGGALFPTVGRLPYALSNIWDPGLNSMRLYFQSFVGSALGLLEPDGTKSANGVCP